MATCEKCGKTYYTRECLRCKDKKNNPSTEKDKLYKTIRYAIIFFIGLFIMGIIIDIIITTYFVKTVNPQINNMNKITNEMMKESYKSMKELNKMNEKFTEKIKKGFKYQQQRN